MFFWHQFYEIVYKKNRLLMLSHFIRLVNTRITSQSVPTLISVFCNSNLRSISDPHCQILNFQVTVKMPPLRQKIQINPTRSCSGWIIDKFQRGYRSFQNFVGCDVLQPVTRWRHASNSYPRFVNASFVLDQITHWRLVQIKFGLL